MMKLLHLCIFGCLVALRYATNVRCGKRTREEVAIEDGDEFVFETQRRNEIEYREFVRCSARYVPGRSCSEIGFSCSKMAVKGRGISCRGDFLEVQIGNKKTRYCRGQKPTETLRSTVSIRLKFWTNRDRREAGGSDCLVKCTRGAGPTTSTTSTTSTTTTTTVSPDGIMTSPKHPGKYPNKYQKTKTIEGADGTVLVIQFTAFNVESHASCKNDYLRIRDGNGTVLMGKTCGTSLPPKITSYTNTVKVDFKTNSKVTRTGWRLVWHAV